MHVATVFAGVPNPYQAGGMLMHWATINALLDAGHRVTFVSLPWDEPPREDRLEALRALGAAVLVLESPQPKQASGRWATRAAYLKSIVWPGDETLFPALASESALAHVVAELQPDAVMADGNSAVSAARTLPVPKLALVGDPPGVTRRLRLRYDPAYPWRLGRDELLYRLGTLTFSYRADRRILQLLSNYDSVGIFGAHRADWARQHGINAWYTRSPIVDAAGPDWRARRAAAPANPKPRILMIGHLRGIATISSLQVFVDDVLPELTRTLGPNGFEVHIAGAHEPPEALRGALEHPAVHLRGHVEPPDDEFLRADVLLVSTPIETGPRVRILSAFSFGCCVVAHTSNKLGIPQLTHEENALLAETPGLARETIRALGDPQLRARLGAAGRQLYENEFTPEQAGASIVAELERIAEART
jgi:glycosyltransferase involved in cell wall biosynthesis